MGKEKYEDYWKKKEQEKKATLNGSTTNSKRDRYETRWAQNYMSSLPSRLEDLSSRRKALYENYTSRFTDKDGNYINAYRDDTGDALTSFKSSKAYIDNETKAILDGLSTYGKYLDADKVKGIQDYLSGYSGDLDSMYKTYQSDHDYFSQWSDEDSYNRAMTYAKEQEEKKSKYSAMSDDELDAEIERLEESKRGNKLTNFAMKYIGTPGIAGASNLPAKAEANQAYNDSVDNDISLIEKEKTNRKYKQIDELPGNVRSLIDELTVIDSKNDDEEFANKAKALLSGFTGGNNVNYNVVSNSERYGEITKELENMGVTNWQELLEYNKLRYNAEKNASTKADYAEMAKEHPVLSSFVSIPASLGKGLGALEMIEHIGSDVPLDPNSPYFGMSDLVNTTRETVMDEHDAHLNTGNETIDNIDLFDELYGTAMSIGDSVVAGVGTSGLKGVGGAVLGLSAASDSAQKVAENGGSVSEAITTGLVAGINEMLWESVSLGKLDELLTNGLPKRGFKTFVKETLKSMGINASEELNTEASNLLADYLINGGASTYSETVQNYLSMGYTGDEAKNQAKKDMLVQMGKAGVGGALQGLFMGGGAGGISTVADAIDNKVYENKFYNQQGQNIIDQGNLSQLIKDTETLGNGKTLKSLKNLANQVSGVKTEDLDVKGSKKYAHQVGKLYKGVQKAQFKSLSKSSETAFKNVIKAELESSGADNVEATADILVKAMHNEGLTRAESKLFQSVNGHEILNKVLSSAEFNKKLTVEEKKQFEESRDNILSTVDLTHDKGKTKILSDSEYNISTDGKTTIEATGEDVDILKIDSLDGDDISLSVESGDSKQVILAGELRLSEDYAVILEGLKDINADFGLDVPSANKILALWDGYDGDAVDFSKAMKSGIMYGQYNMRKDFDNSRMGRNVPDNIREELFRTGREYKQRVTTEQNANKKTKANASKNGDFSITFAEGVSYKKLNKSQKAQVDMAQIISQAMGFNLEVFRSPKNALGKSMGENGSYNTSTNTMRLDIDAGTLDGKSLILFTQSHELTHFIKEWSPEKFKVFSDFLVEKYGEKDVPLQVLVQRKIDESVKQTEADKTGKHHVLSYDEALEEVVCDACEDFLADPNIQQTILMIAEVDQSIAQKIKNFIKNLINRLEKALRGLKGQSLAAQYTRSLDTESIQELKDLWVTALVDSRENVLQARKNDVKAQKNTTDEGDVKHQARFKGHSNIENNGKNRYNKHSFYSNFDSLAMNWAHHPDTKVGDTNIFFRNDVAVLVEATDNGFFEISSGNYEEMRFINEQAHRKPNRGLYANLNRIEARRNADSWDLQYVENGRYDVRDAQQDESQGVQVDSERDNEHLRSGDKRESVKFQDRDSLGRTLTEAQQSYFADSKIRDENGNLMVMYHGSPKDDISSFRLSLGGAYFTANSDYAREYARDVGKVYEVYLNITKPFDTRNAECRAIFEKEFYGQWGNGAPLGAKGLPDWTDGDDLIEFLQEKGYDYDGLLLDEGGVPVETGVKDRGISYVVFDKANQVKYTDNLKPTTNEDMKFSMRENVEETKDLVAVHNLSEENLLKSLKLGGLPMPSIAIIKAKNGHNNFGDISLVFDKSTIDPKLSKYNKVFTSDAYTPTYPHIDYKIDRDVVEKGVDEVERLIKSKGYGKDDFGYLSSIDGDNFRYGNTEEVANKTALKVAYLIDKGIDFTPIYEEKQYSGFGLFDNEAIKYIADAIGKERINELHNNTEGVKKTLEEIRNLASEQKAEKYKDKEDLFKLLKEKPYYGENNFGFAQAHEIVEGAYNYFNNGTQTKIDEWQTGRAIKDLIDNDDYKKWVDNLFNGFIEKEGIRNNVDLFTPSGNRRSFEALHWEHNLENVIKSMRTGLQQGNALFGSSIYGASQVELKSIADIKNESDRLVDVDSEDNKASYQEKRKDLELRFTELVSSIVKDNGSNVFIAMDDASAVLVESVLKCKTKTAMDNYIKRELEGWGNYSNTLAEDLMDIVKELRALPTGYFEAKPQRAVVFDEVKAVIVPDNCSQELRKQLDSMGVNVLTYENGNDNSRIDVLNSIEDVKFQDRPYQPSLEDLGIDYKEENERLKADADRLKEMLKLQGTVTHGKVLAKASYKGVAKKLLHSFGMKRVTDADLVKELVNRLDSFYSYIINEDDLMWDEMFNKSMDIAKWLDGKLPEQVVYKNPNAVEILRDIREKGIMLSDKQKEEAAYYAGSLSAYRKMNFGNFKIVNEGGISLTDLWEQIVSDYPGAISQEYIEQGEVAENLPSLIVEVVELMRQTENVINDDNRLSYLRDMATEIYDSYWNIPTVKTLADKHQQKVNLLRSKHKEEMNALKDKNDTKLKNTKEYYQDMVRKIRADKDAKLNAYKERVTEQKKKNVEGRNKTATKNKIKRVIKTLESLYGNPTKEKNVKIEFQDMVRDALVLANVLFDDGNISSSDILSGNLTIRLGENERKKLDEWRKVYERRQDYRDKLDALESSGKVNQKTHDELLDMINRCNNKLNRLGRDLSDVVERQKAELNEESLKNAIDSLVEAYKSLEDSTEGYAKAAYNDYVAKRLDALKTSLKNTTVKTMTLTQLDEVYQAYKMVLTTVRTANELFVNNKRMSVTEMGEAVIREVENVAKPTDDKVAALRDIRKYSWEELKPIYAFERIGSKTLLELFKDARKGEDVLGRDVADAQSFFREKSRTYGYDSWDFDERKDFKLADGRTFNISLQEIMSVYAYSKREQALDHITDGGFVFDNKKFFKDTTEGGIKGWIKGQIKKERTTVEAYRLNDDVFYKVINSLTKEQKKFVDDMQEYLSTVMGEKGNEVSRLIYGIDLFKEKFYFPLMSSDDFIQQTNNPAGEVVLKNSGMAKATVPHAQNPIVLQDFMDVWTEHVNKMSTYHALVLPIENLNKVFNYTGYARDNRSVSVQTILKGVYGDAVNRYITNFITDLNGGIKTQSSGNWVTKGISRFKKTAVAASTSVVVQQPTAIVRAMAMINPKYFVHKSDGLKHNEAWEELKKYAPIAIVKEMGGFDVGSGKQVADYITAKTYKGKDKVKGFVTDSSYRDEAFMWGATKADESGWITIWNAVKREIADTTTHKVGSDEFLKACGERFTDIITYTQVYDSVFSRSGFMRNKGEISKMATSFMGEPTTSFNMLYNAVLQAKRGNIKKGKAVRIAAATMVSVVLAAVAKSFIYALHDDDDDEAYAEKYAQALINSLSEDIWIHNMLPYVSDVTSLLSGWDVERTDMAIFKDVIDAFDDIDSSSKSAYRKAEDLLGAFAALFGFPLKNIMRTGREMYNMVANILYDNTADIEGFGEAALDGLEESFYNSFIVDKVTGGYKGGNSASDINEALEKGKTDKAKKIINEIVADKVKQGETEKEAKASIKSSVTSYWKELYLQAYRDKDNVEMLRIRRILQSTGLYDDVVETCSNWIKSMKDEKTTDTTFKKR